MPAIQPPSFLAESPQLSPVPVPLASHRPWGPWLLIATVMLASFLFLHLPIKTTDTGDSVPYRYLPLALIQHHTFRLDAYPQLAAPQYYAVVRDRTGHLISKKPVTPAFFKIPAFIGYRLLKGHWPGHEYKMIHLGKLTMSVMAALAAGLLTATLGSGTLLQGIAIASRLGAIAVAIAFLGAAVLIKADRRQLRLHRLGYMLLGLLPCLALLGAYNLHYFGHPLNSDFGDQAQSRIRWPIEGIAGLFFSPGKGIFLYSPVLTRAFEQQRQTPNKSPRRPAFSKGTPGRFF